MIIYAGIGARKTPPNILSKMQSAAKAMATMGFLLRSGGSAGADEAFEIGCDLGGGEKEIFLPYQGFRKNHSPNYIVTKEARMLAAKFHPNWPVVGPVGRDFLGRDCYEVLGFDLDTPATFVLCYTPDGKEVGGTGQTLRVAKHYNIPILNFGDTSDDDISDFIFAVNEKGTAS